MQIYIVMVKMTYDCPTRVHGVYDSYDLAYGALEQLDHADVAFIEGPMEIEKDL